MASMTLSSDWVEDNLSSGIHARRACLMGMTAIVHGPFGTRRGVGGENACRRRTVAESWSSMPDENQTRTAQAGTAETASDGQPNPGDWLDLHGDYLFRYALIRVRNETVAEDLVQDTLLAALKSRDRYCGGNSERGWLTGILRHKIFDHFRRL